MFSREKLLQLNDDELQMLKKALSSSEGLTPLMSKKKIELPILSDTPAKLQSAEDVSCPSFPCNSVAELVQELEVPLTHSECCSDSETESVPQHLSEDVIEDEILSQRTPEEMAEETVEERAEERVEETTSEECDVPHSSNDHLQQLFVDICRVADQMQSKYSKEMRTILKHVFHALESEEATTDASSVKEGTTTGEPCMHILMDWIRM